MAMGKKGAAKAALKTATIRSQVLMKRDMTGPGVSGSSKSVSERTRNSSKFGAAAKKAEDSKKLATKAGVKPKTVNKIVARTAQAVAKRGK